ncbi:NAD(P)H-dependent glycerol-3-phosphate dehydrogenase [Rhodocytophaga aerolata]|uniref:Glycerol-3-phosphate dehydrogenase n=1 Tax=Rhodocytophaga aerolata TaxID=455078 RepID=A0ABT8R5G8_9BACT|nr:NAD(P)H-dependent glycerol-3-phosphate dehydrogenase [Rhodocytophaga aerolata]MDO1447346.1 NAD(P)H-dependent glycerol-3-phosphate dehydrogenase [Rhodocytophaga aerolata]
MKPKSTYTSELPCIAIIGGGSWATAIIKILSEKELKIKWWLRNEEDVNYISQYGHNPHYLSDVQINLRKVKAYTDIRKTVEKARYVIMAVPAAFVQQAMQGLLPEHLAGKTLISAIKGMIPGENLLVTDWVERDFRVPAERLCVIAGPCHAEEVALEKQSYLTIASQSIDQAADFANLMSCRFVQASPTDDVYGIEYCAVMKNIIALACGITHGLNYGDNFQAVLVSNAMQEIKRFIDHIYPKHRDLSGSAYLGDLLVTAYSQFSRNRTFGNMIGRGYSVKSAQVEMNMIAEGYYAVKSIHEINKEHKVSMPITEMVYSILYEKTPPHTAVQALKEVLR